MRNEGETSPPAIDTTNLLSQASHEYVSQKLEQHKKLQESEEENSFVERPDASLAHSKTLQVVEQIVERAELNEVVLEAVVYESFSK
jgi:hypothetical protein